MLHLAGLLSSYFAHDARSQEPKAYVLPVYYAAWSGRFSRSVATESALLIAE